MHGRIHTGLANFVKSKHGTLAWKKIMEEALLADRLYLQVGSYPDEEIQALVIAAEKVLDVSADELLEEFGFYLVPQLIDDYRSYIDPQWKTIELLLNTEQTIHRVVRLKDKHAAPPRLQFRQVRSNTLVLDYDSPRKMQAVARGMIRGVADWYGERVLLKERNLSSGRCQLEIAVIKGDYF